jgi:hypothetical protein
LTDGEIGFERELKTVAEEMARVRRTVQQVARLSASWDLRTLRQRLPEARNRLREAAELLAALGDRLEADGEAALVRAAAAYRDRFLAEAQAQGLKPQGTFPEYEIFPLKVVFDLSGGSVSIGRERLTALEPKAVARALRRASDRLHRSSFNAGRFMRALLAYHELLEAAGRTRGRRSRLIDIYRLMSAPSGTAAYSRQDFAFAIYRLRRESDLVCEGRQLAFGHAREGGFTVPTGRGDVENLAWLEVTPLPAADAARGEG